jgi:hypothetical protein
MVQYLKILDLAMAKVEKVNIAYTLHKLNTLSPAFKLVPSG